MRTVFGIICLLALAAGIMIQQPAHALSTTGLRKLSVDLPERTARVGDCPIRVSARVVLVVEERQIRACEKKIGRRIVAEDLAASYTSETLDKTREAVGKQSSKARSRSRRPRHSAVGKEDAWEIAPSASAGENSFSSTASLNNQMNMRSLLSFVSTMVEVVALAWGVATVVCGVIEEVSKKEECIRLASGFICIVLGLSAPIICQRLCDALYIFGS